MTHFYIISESDGIYKLGFAQDFGVRLSSLQTGNPRELIGVSYMMRDGRLFEDWVHRMFKDNLIRGEWYKLTIEQIELIQRNAENAYVECTCKGCECYYMEKDRPVRLRYATRTVPVGDSPELLTLSNSQNLSPDS